MQKKVQEEGEKEKTLFDRFMCYCKTGKNSLVDSIAAAEAKAPAISSDIEEAQGLKTQLDGELKQHQTDRDAARASMADATAIREKEAAAYATSKAEHTKNIEAIAKAVAALEKGMSGNFLQTNAARVLRTLIQ